MRLHVIRCKCGREQVLGEDPDPEIGVRVIVDVSVDEGWLARSIGWAPVVSGCWACPFCVCRRCEGRGAIAPFSADGTGGASCLVCGGSGCVAD